MKEKVLALAKGHFTYKTPAPVLNPGRLDMTLTAGGTKVEKIRIRNKAGTKIKGFAAAEEEDMEFLPVFDAIESELTLTVSAGERKAGEVMKGTLAFVTDCGEATLPYEIKITAPVLSDEKGEITDYYVLQERIKENPEKGAELFCSEEFASRFLYRDRAGWILYHHLRARNTKLHAMEEFLIAMGKKPVLHFEIMHAAKRAGEIFYEIDGHDVADSLKIRVNTWGVAAIRVSADADFICPKMHTLWVDEFENNMDVLEYTIQADKVKNGIRHGKLIFESPYEKREIRIGAGKRTGRKERKTKRERMAVTASVLRMYLAWREERVTGEEFQNLIWNNRRFITESEYCDETIVAGLVAAFLRDESEMVDFYRKTEGILPPLQGQPLTEVEKYIGIQYIKYLYSQRDDDREAVSRSIRMYGEGGYDSFLLFCLKLQTDEEYRELHKRAQSIREEIRKGTNSPFLYSELLLIYREDPTLISEMDPVTVATVNYGLKTEAVTEDMAVVLGLLAERSAQWNPLVFRIMTEIYARFPSEDMLRAICRLLIRNEVRDHRYFRWFDLGVKAQLRITDLYEYYMYAMDTSSVFRLPETVLTYFRYENHLHASCKAFLYAYIVKKRESIPDYYAYYEDTIREFACTELSRHRISEDLACLYENVFSEENITDSVAADLPKVMFKRLLTCYHPGMEGVLVIHPEAEEEHYYPLVDGQALIEIYTKDAQFVFVDAGGAYYCGSVEYRLQKFLNMESYAMACRRQGSQYTPLLVWLAVTAERGVRLTQEQADLIYEALQSGILRKDIRGRFFARLYDYYKKQNEANGLYMVLKDWQTDLIPGERSGEIASACIRCGLTKKAEQILSEHGVEGCEREALSEFLSEKIKEKEDTFVPKYVKWAFYLYREHCEEWCVLNYLSHYFMGNTETLTAIYRRCQSLFGESAMDDACRERLLGQVLFTGTPPETYEDIFLSYYENGNNRVLVKAVLSEFAYRYITDRLEISESVFVKIEKEALYKKESIMVLATLKYYSHMREYAKKQKEFIGLWLEKFVGEGIILSFMKEFEGKAEVPEEIENAIIVQHFSETEKGVFLHLYEGGEERYTSYPLKEVLDGVYTAGLLLFAGEKVRGCVYEEEGDRCNQTMQWEMPEKTGQRAQGFCRMLNDMILAKRGGDEKKLEDTRKKYLEMHQTAEKLFVVY